MKESAMAMSTEACCKIDCAWWVLKITYGLLFIAAGADKFFNMITIWSKYLSPLVLEHIPLEPHKLLMAVGIIEILIGLAILTHWTKIGAYLAMAWLLIISANLLSMGMGVYVDIAVRDIVMAMGALVLACLTKVKCMLVCEVAMPSPRP
jgi:uncharacterized membrane protein YphA (DoxX/SURF4 family)